MLLNRKLSHTLNHPIIQINANCYVTLVEILVLHIVHVNENMGNVSLPK